MTTNPPSEEILLAEQLQRLIQAIEASSRAVLPHSNDELLLSIVEAAQRIFGAAAASIALVNQKEQTLDFKVAVGVGNENVVGMSISFGKGIVGYVAMTGQPIAISNLQHDARFDRDFAQSTGYVPRSILATPLLREEGVIGVMEVLDKIDAPSFGMQDMELLGIFAKQAAIAIHQSQQYEQIGESLVRGLKELVAEDTSTEAGELLQALEKVHEEDREMNDLLSLANLFNEIAALGEEERKTCLKIMAAFAEYRQATRFSRRRSRS
jgi:GAF domain-containing protein